MCELFRPVCKLSLRFVGASLLLNRFQGGGTRDEVVGHPRDLGARSFEPAFLLFELGLSPRECGLAFAQPRVGVFELELAALDRRLRLRGFLLATPQRGFGLLNLELTREQRGLPFSDLALPRNERVEPLLSLRLAPCEQLFRIGAIRFLWTLGPP